MPKINFLYLILCSNLVLLILSEKVEVIYDEKKIEDMKSSLWNSNSEGFYYLDFNPIREHETIIALTSIKNDEEQSKGYTDIITYKKVNEEYHFYLYKYNKENYTFKVPENDEDELFHINDNDIESVRNLYVGNFTGNKMGYLVSFNKKNEETLIHYLVYNDTNTKISLTKKYNIKSNIIILNRNANNKSQIVYQDDEKFQTCVLNDKYECDKISNFKGDENKGICKMSLKGGVAYVDVDGNCSPDKLIFLHYILLFLFLFFLA